MELSSVDDRLRIVISGCREGEIPVASLRDRVETVDGTVTTHHQRAGPDRPGGPDPGAPPRGGDDVSPLTGRARLAWALCGVSIALAGVHTWLFIGWSEVRSSPNGWPVLTIGLPLWGVLGAMIVTRRPRHRVGWLFIAGAVLSGLANCLACYDLIATSGPSPDPSVLWPWAVWLAIFLDVPEPLMFLILVFLLFPTGHLPSPRWRPLLWASWLSFGGFVVVMAVAVPPSRIEVGNREELIDGAVVPVVLVLLVSMLVELLAAAASVVVRMRRSTGVERQQLRWLAVSASMVAVSFVLAATLPFHEGLADFLRVLPLHLSVVAVVAGAALAILRYRLYDLDVVISRAIILTASTVVVAAGYIALVVVVGGTSQDATTGSGRRCWRPPPWPSRSSPCAAGSCASPTGWRSGRGRRPTRPSPTSAATCSRHQGPRTCCATSPRR